jgi:hypothetical protein
MVNQIMLLTKQESDLEAALILHLDLEIMGSVMQIIHACRKKLYRISCFGVAKLAFNSVLV